MDDLIPSRFGHNLATSGRGISRRVVSRLLTITHTQRDREVAVSAAPFIVKTVSRIHPVWAKRCVSLRALGATLRVQFT